jgi:diaminohydroxyphosphoribosylaminopyrimidine deaminase/5-amino-6-(5-phosphoribosylamino)uracil reductase
VVVDGAGRTPANARVNDRAAETWLVTSADRGRVDLQKMLEQLYGRGVRTALLEGGPTLAGAFLAAGLIDRVVAYVAPKLLGAGPAALGDAGIGTIAGAIDLDLIDVIQIGSDVRLTATVKGA